MKPEASTFSKVVGRASNEISVSPVKFKVFKSSPLNSTALAVSPSLFKLIISISSNSNSTVDSEPTLFRVKFKASLSFVTSAASVANDVDKSPLSWLLIVISTLFSRFLILSIPFLPLIPLIV